MRGLMSRAVVVAGAAAVLLGGTASWAASASSAAPSASPSLTTTPNPTSVTLGTTPPTLTDSAVLAGGSSPTGTITFTLLQGGTAVVDVETVTVSGDGTYKTITGFTTSTPGTYQWDASYSGDQNNNPVSDNGDPAEQVVVSPANPTLKTTPHPAAVTLGTVPTTLTDTAVLTGGASPTGTITFTLFQGSNPSPIDVETVAVSGNGTYKTVTGFTTSTTGTYQWDATYSGDTSNNPVADTGNPRERVQVTRWHVIFGNHVGPPANFTGLRTITSAGQKDAWAFGASDTTAFAGPIAYRWQGQRWRASTLPSGLGSAIGAASEPAAGDVWALGPAGYVLHFDGTRWNVAKRFHGDGFAEFSDIVAFSPANVWVFGGPSSRPGLGTFHFNGRTWTKVTAATKLGIFAVSALSARDIWATGTSKSRFDSIDHYTGTWHRVTASALQGLAFFNIMALAKNNVWAVAEGGSHTVVSYLVHFNGSQWVKFKPPWTVYFSGMAADWNGGIWFTAIDGSHASWVVHRTGSGQWQRILISRSSPGMESLAKIPGTSSLWAVGSLPHGPGTNATIWALG